MNLVWEEALPVGFSDIMVQPYCKPEARRTFGNTVCVLQRHNGLSDLKGFLLSHCIE